MYVYLKYVCGKDERSQDRDKTSVVTLHSYMAHESVDRWRQQWGKGSSKQGWKGVR